MRKPTPNQTPFHMKTHYRQARVALRTPLLSMAEPRRVSFSTWERAAARNQDGSAVRERVSVTLSKRSERQDLASIRDAPVFHYAASRFRHAYDQAHGCAVPSLRLSLTEILSDLGRPFTAGEVVVDALRRITNTLVTVSRGSRRSYPTAQRLIDITRDEGGDFELAPSTWLEDDLLANGVYRAPPSTSSLGGIRQRLYGWMIAWVGREQADGRVIWMREILDRLGPLWDGAGDPWDEVCVVVAKNDLPDFHAELTTDRGSPAIFLRPRQPRRDEEPRDFRLPPLELSLDDDEPDLLGPAPPPIPREISL